MFAAPQYVTGHFTPQKVFLPDREYGLALDALVKGCSDVLILSSDRQCVLLGRRKVDPQPDWWFIGGRSRPGDTTQAAACRNVKREVPGLLNLAGDDNHEKRFEVVGNYSMVWNYRVQPPTSNGTADLSTIHAICLTKEEEEKLTDITLDTNEYSESKWLNINEIIKNDNDRYHPLLVNSLKSLRAKDSLVQLEKTIDDDQIKHTTNTAMITEKAIEFIKRVKDARVHDLSIKVVFDPINLKYIRYDDQEKEKKNEETNGEKASAKRPKTTTTTTTTTT